MHKAAQAYRQTQVTTTSQGDIVVMLYDGAITFLNRAKERLAANDMAGKGNAISKALDVINELDGSLNREKGGDLAANLHGLYSFCNKHLLMANIKKSSVMIDEVIKILAGLRSAYAEILTMPEAQAAAQQAAANVQSKSQQSARMNTATTFGASPAPSPGAEQRMRATYAKAAAGASLMESADMMLAQAIPAGHTEQPATRSGTQEPEASNIKPGEPKAGLAEANAASAEGMGSSVTKFSNLKGGELYRRFAAAQK